MEVLINEAKFEYDIHSLIKAFYPDKEIKVVMDSEDPDFIVNYKSDGVSFSVSGHKEVSASFSENTERTEEKNVLKRLIYSALSKETKKTLPWGTLTGIRPTKIPMKLLSEGKTDEEILSFMKETYFVSDDKGLLSIDIAKRESAILGKINTENGYSLYIGIPFCPTTCLYCSFTSNPICKWEKKVDEYLECLDKELKATTEIMKGRNPDTVHFLRQIGQQHIRHTACIHRTAEHHQIIAGKCQLLLTALGQRIGKRVVIRVQLFSNPLGNTDSRFFSSAGTTEINSPDFSRFHSYPSLFIS